MRGGAKHVDLYGSPWLVVKYTHVEYKPIKSEAPSYFFHTDPLLYSSILFNSPPLTPSLKDVLFRRRDGAFRSIWSDESNNSISSNNRRVEALWVRIVNRYKGIRLQGTNAQTFEQLCNHWKHVSADINVFESNDQTSEETLESNKRTTEIMENTAAWYEKLTRKPSSMRKVGTGSKVIPRY